MENYSEAENTRRELKKLTKNLDVLENNYRNVGEEITYVQGELSKLLIVEKPNPLIDYAPLEIGAILALNNSDKDRKDLVEFLKLYKKSEIYSSSGQHPIYVGSLLNLVHPTFDDNVLLDRTYLWLSCVEDYFGMDLGVDERVLKLKIHLQKLKTYWEEVKRSEDYEKAAPTVENESPEVQKYVYEGANTIFAEYVAYQIPWLEQNLKNLYKERESLQYRIELSKGGMEKIELERERKEAMVILESEMKRLENIESREINDHPEIYVHNGHLRDLNKNMEKIKNYIKENKGARWLMEVLGVTDKDGYGRMVGKHNKKMEEISQHVSIERFVARNPEYRASWEELKELSRLNSMKETYESENTKLIEEIRSNLVQFGTPKMQELKRRINRIEKRIKEIDKNMDSSKKELENVGFTKDIESFIAS